MALRCWLLSAVVVTAIGCSGDSPSTGEQSGDMDDLAAMLDSARPSSGPSASSASAPESRATGRDNAAATPAADPDLPTRRGFALHDLSNELAYVMVKADADKVAEAVAGQLNGQVSQDIWQQPVDTERTGTIVYQLKGHPWTIFAVWPGGEMMDRAAKLSTELKTDVLTFANSDFSGWSFVELYRDGESVEAVNWGLDYTDEGLAGPDLSRWDAHTKITTTDSNGVTLTDQYVFRSKLRKVTEADLKKGEAFVDWFYKQHDAYLPDAPDMVWLREDGKATSPLGAGVFSGAYAITVDKQ